MEAGKSALFLWGTKQTAEGLAEQGIVYFGFSDGNSVIKSVWTASNDAADPSNTARGAGNTELKIPTNGDSVNNPVAEATIAYTSSGFDLTWNPNDAVAYIIHYLAISGLKNVEVGSFAQTTATGNQVVSLTNTAMVPNFLMLIGIGSINQDPNSANHAHLQMGWATSSTNRACIGVDAEDGRATMDTWNLNRQTAIIQAATPSDGTTDSIVDFVSFGTGQFTINDSDAPAAADYLYYLVIEGDVAFGTFTAITAGADQSITGLAFKPKALMVFTTDDTSTRTAYVAEDRLTIGGTDGVDEGCTVCSDDDGAGVAAVFNRTTTSKLIQTHTETNGALKSEADFKSFDNTGFTITWTDLGGAVIYYYIAIGDNAEYMAAVNSRVSSAKNPEIRNSLISKFREKPAVLRELFYHNLSRWIPSDLKNNVFVTDSGAGSETILVNKGLLIAESGSGLETILVNKNLLVTDSGLGSDSVFVGKKLIIIDSGSGSDVVNVVKNLFIADTGAGADNLFVNKNVLLLETGSGVEAIKLSKNLIVTDTGVGTESLLLNKNLIVADLASGVEVVLVGKNVIIIDSGAATEFVNVLKNILISETGTGLESVQINKNLILSEIASGLDSVLTSKNLLLTESGSGIDAVKINKTLFIADSALGVEQILVGKSIALQELGTGQDVLYVGKHFRIADTGIGSENIIVVTGDMSTNRLTTVKVLLLRAKNRINLMRSPAKAELQRTIAKTTLLRNSVKSFLKRSKTKVILEDE